jgi:hypothetical protein
LTNGAKLDGCLVSLLSGVATVNGVSILAAGVKLTTLGTVDNMKKKAVPKPTNYAKIQASG